uniref:Transposase n=1 Tax=Panagrellus redivivus TaxID=6233 RepID=A0A7E4VZZ8_PANRE
MGKYSLHREPVPLYTTGTPVTGNRHVPVTPWENGIGPFTGNGTRFRYLPQALSVIMDGTSIPKKRAR